MESKKTIVVPESCSDQEFILHIYRKLNRLMFYTANKYTVDCQYNEEVVQESIRKLIEKIPTLRGLSDAALTYYVVATVRNTAINLLKRQKRQLGVVACIGDPQEDDLHDTTPSLDDLLIMREQIDKLKEVWPQLDEETRYILEGKYILGYDNDELSKFLDCKPNSVRMKLTRARRKVLNLLKEGESLDET